MIFPRENHYFQEIEDKKQQNKFKKCIQFFHLFWYLDFGCILGGFWGGLGRPKWKIFSYFPMFLEDKFWMLFGTAKFTKNMTFCPVLVPKWGPKTGPLKRDSSFFSTQNCYFRLVGHFLAKTSVNVLIWGQYLQYFGRFLMQFDEERIKNASHFSHHFLTLPNQFCL